MEVTQLVAEDVVRAELLSGERGVKRSIVIDYHQVTLRVQEQIYVPSVFAQAPVPVLHPPVEDEDLAPKLYGYFLYPSPHQFTSILDLQRGESRPA